jgi:hypothetical protein
MAAGAFFHFASQHFADKMPTLPAGWTSDNATIERFHTFLNAQHISFDEAEFTANRRWVADQLRWEMYSRALGKKDADRAAIESDPEIAVGIDSLPKAQALFQQVQKVLARRAEVR